jgi:elongation factor Ts
MATIEEIKKLRALTGAGVTAVKEALEHGQGDVDKAVAYLREKGMSKAAKRADRVISNGYIGKYIHNNGKVVVLVELGSETDFASNSADFRDFADKLALHIAASNPSYVSVDRVPADVIEKEKAVFAQDVAGKPEEVANKILEGKLGKFYSDNVLMKQELFGATGTVEDNLNELIGKIGEKIEIGKMIKFHIGGEMISDLALNS